ncbi:ATP-binding protein [Anaeroselena agilis]|uniref:histidine kinase n=1 Tax=Anaeroselena agilis TaxID=3063788 RepID=A0ABU3NS92_9FIRM|nr:sensor histidine kinase KdpD [Selenomonadales bacterium 4137-cl]
MPTVNKQEQRPDPEAILGKLDKAARGKLTVFLGAAAGVGKTYSMLEAAHERLSNGSDVVIGWVETHGRQETERLAAGLPKISAKIFAYRGKELAEMDIDAIITRKPELVLVDELAHTNVPGSRHVRRFQDVEELIDAGINVYTTLNIQHIESLNDMVAQITGVVVRETVPDHIIEEADNVQLIDMPPEDLIKRLKEGKVYVPGQAERALKNFFRPGNINALREMSLRFTASRVDKQLSEYMREHQIDGPWPAAGRIMVCVSASPFSAQLIRVARRLAAGQQAEWLAVHVETARRFPVGDAERDRVARNMRLAEELGAQILSSTADNLAEEILEIARSRNVTAIVIGKPRHGRVREFLYGSVVDKLIRNGSGINVCVIQAKKEKAPGGSIATANVGERANWSHYVLSLLMVAAVTLFNWVLHGRIELVNVALIYQLPVAFSAFWWGRWPAYFSAVCSVLLFDLLFVPPIFTFTVDDVRYVWSFLSFLVVAFVIGGRTELLRYEATAARVREKSTRALYDFSREIVAVIDLDTIVRKLAGQAADALGRRVVVLLPDANGSLAVWAERDPGSGELLSDMSQDNKVPLADSAEAAVAVWSYEHRQVAGRSTETLPAAQYLYLPLNTRESTVGVLGIRIVEKLITHEQRRLMNAWAGLAAIAIERVKLTEEARQAALLAESDRLRSALFNSVSHELRTPMATIIGSSSTLLEAEDVYSAAERRSLIETIKEGAARINLILLNLLDTARLESGMLQLKYDWCDIEDIIGTALRQLADQTKGRPLNVKISDDVPLLRGDCVLLVQVLVNLLDNAIKYSPRGTGIEIKVGSGSDSLQVSVVDHGAGISEADLPRIFDKFFRIQRRTGNVPGTGLGLSICKGLVEAHGGKIWAENAAGGGAVISFTLPLGNNQAILQPESE